jgi:hypothetical protein
MRASRGFAVLGSLAGQGAVIEKVMAWVRGALQATRGQARLPSFHTIRLLMIKADRWTLRLCNLTATAKWHISRASPCRVVFFALRSW